ncbi:MAG: DUF998 domain-containing protein [Treponema sp.]|nr:DUF998 domain-containing protein [Treponema sp.]
MDQKTWKRTRINYLGLLGTVSFISYTAAVLFSPLDYPGYDWMSQAVSDLSASNSPSLQMWQRLSALYGVCGLVSIMMVCVYIRGKLTKTIRHGIYTFACMNWISSAGYTVFPLSESGYSGTFSDIMHVYVVTALVVILSIVSLLCIMAGGYRNKKYLSLAVWASAALAFMFAGAVGAGAVPRAYFGIVERCSVFSAVAFNAVLGIYLYCGFWHETDRKG